MRTPDEIFNAVEDQWKHIAFDPKANKIWLLTDPYHCLDTKADWFDAQDGQDNRKVRNNAKRVRESKTKDWIYICPK